MTTNNPVLSFTNILIVVIGFFILGGLADLRLQVNIDKAFVLELEKKIIMINEKHHRSDMRYYNEIKDIVVFKELRDVRAKKKK